MYKQLYLLKFEHQLHIALLIALELIEIGDVDNYPDRIII